MLKETSVIYQRYNPNEPAVVVQTAGVEYVHQPELRQMIEKLGLPFDEFKDLLRAGIKEDGSLHKIVSSSVGIIETSKVNLPRKMVSYRGITSVWAPPERGFDVIYVLSGRATFTFPESVTKNEDGSLKASDYRLNANIGEGSLAIIPFQTGYGLSWVGSNFSYLLLRRHPDHSLQKQVLDDHPVIKESHRYLSSERFTATREMMDSLRLYFSALTAEEQEDVRGMSLLIHSVLMSKYFNYIDSYTLEEKGGVEDRVLVTDQETYDALFKVMHMDNDETSSIGTVYQAGAITHIVHPREALKKLDEEKKKTLGEDLLSSSQIEEYVFMNLLAHEMAHHYQAQLLSRPFFEAGARYYARDILRTLGLPYWENYIEKICLKHYEALIRKYGEVIHGVFFGKIKDFALHNAIDSETDAELQEIVDKGYI